MAEIDFSSYLTDEERKKIIVEEFRNYVQTRTPQDYERVAQNGAYRLVWEHLDKEFDGNLEGILKEKAASVVRNLKSFDVFRQASYGEKRNSVARDVLDEAIKSNRDLVAKRVKSLINDLSREDIWELLADREVSFGAGEPKQ